MVIRPRLGSNSLMLRFCSGFLLLALLSPAPALAQWLIEGVGNNLANTLRDNLTPFESPCTASEARARAVARQSLAQVGDLLRAFGYYRPEITQHSVRDEQGCWQISLNISLGEATRIVRLDIQLEGAAEADGAFIELVQGAPFTVGDQLNHARYEAYKTQFQRLATRRGYYDARFSTSQIQVEPERAEAVIVLHFLSGERYRYGQTLIQEAGPSVDFLHRFIPYASGDPVDAAELIELQQRLIDSQYFSVVSVRPQIEQRQNGLVDIRISLEPVKTWHFSVGAGVDTNSGPRASLAVENRLLNGQGDRASMETSLSPLLKQLELTHRHPLADPTRELRQWQLGVLSEETDSSRSIRQSLGWSRVRLMDGGWIRTLGASYSRESSTIGTLQVESQLLLPSLALHKSARTGERRIAQGWRVGFDLSGALDNLLSDTSLLQAHLDAKGILPLGQGRLIGRVELGATWVARFREVPASIRYFAGGDNSVRGYDFESLGPRDAEGNVVGGRHLSVASLEYDRPIAENWDLALFVDIGDAFNNEPSLKRGAGVGIRWHTLVGTIRLDLAWPSDGTGARLHLFMGPEI